MIISLNPYLEEIIIDNRTDFFGEFVSCINQGMQVEGYVCRLVGTKLKTTKSIEVKLANGE